MAKNWLRRFSIAGRTEALLDGIVVDGKPRRVNSEFDKMSDADMLLKNGMGDLEVVAVRISHLDAVDQLVPVGKLLDLKILFERHDVTACLPGIDLVCQTDCHGPKGFIPIVPSTVNFLKCVVPFNAMSTGKRRDLLAPAC